MTRVRYAQNGFSGGQLAPLMYGREDFQKYSRGAKLLKNFIVDVRSEIVRRAGTVFFKSTYNDLPAHIVSYEPNVNVRYLLEFTNGNLRVINEITGDVEASFVTPYTYLESKRLGICSLTNVVVFTSRGKPIKSLLRYEDGTWEFKDLEVTPWNEINSDETLELTLDGSSTINPTVDGFYLVPDTENLGDSVEDPYFNPATLPHLKVGRKVEWALSTFEDPSLITNQLTFIIDSLNLVDGYQSRIAFGRVSGNYASQFANVSDVNSDRFRISDSVMRVNNNFVENTTPVPVDTGARLKIVKPTPTIEAGSGNLTSNKPIFTVNDVGRYIRLRVVDEITTEFGTDFTPRWISVKITAYVSPTEVGTNYSGKKYTEIKYFRFGAFYGNPDEGLSNYPAHVSFFQGRLIFANTRDHPNRLWLSESGRYFSFNEIISSVDEDGISFIENVQADGAIMLEVGEASTLSEISWISTLSGLLVGTPSNIWNIRSNDYSEGLTSANANATMIDQTPASYVKPVATNNTLIFSHFTDKIIYGLSQTQQYAYSAVPLSYIASNIIQSGVTQIVNVEYPANAVIYVLNDGTLGWHSFNRETELSAFSYLETQGKFISCCYFKSKPYSPNNAYRNTYFVVEREGKYYIESLSTISTVSDEYSDSIFSDSSVYVDYGTLRPSLSINESRFSHLKGKQVVLTYPNNKWEYADFSVGTTFTFKEPTDKVIVGLPYTSRFESLKPEFGARKGSSIGVVDRISNMHIKVYNSARFTYGVNNQSKEVLYDSSFGGNLTYNLNYDSLYSGLCQVENIEGWLYNEGMSITIQQVDPVPLVILSLYYDLEVGETV